MTQPSTDQVAFAILPICCSVGFQKPKLQNSLSTIHLLFFFFCLLFSPPSFPLGIVHKGNGENMFISQQPPVISTVMGNGHQRSVSCSNCNGLALNSKLFAPVALASGPDGSLYIGDFNFVRRIFPSGNSIGILELR